ncbi:MAG: hypothetical protein KGM49_07780 [Sphingomonadales bacterium]|nr:hypothetical protein [Sphingomonadales bacterium]
MRLRLKRLVLRLLRHLPGARVLTIVPFDIEPDFAKIAHGWIHDLQNWDGALGTATDPAATEQLSLAIRKAAGERLVCCAIGGQNRHKGFDRFAAIYADNPDLRARMLFAYGGKVAAPLGAASERFEQVGGFALNRFISDAELTAFYHAADIIWCVYDPAYDQASGLLGRAMQFGIPVAVRSGSVIERICRMEGHPHLALASIDDWDGLLSPPPAMPLAEAADRARRHGQVSLAKLAEALGVKPANDPFASPPQVP